MEPTSHQPFGSVSSPANGAAPSTNTSPADAAFSTTAAHATGDNPYPADSPTLPAAASGVKAKLDDALESGKKWLHTSGVAEQAQQLPQKAKELGTKALAGAKGLTTGQKTAIVGIVAAGVAFLITQSKSKSKKSAPEYRDKPRKSPFDHQPSTRDGDHAYDRKGQRPWGASRYGTSPTPPKPAGKGRPLAGSGYAPTAPTDRGHAPDHGRPTPSHRGPSAGPGPRRDQGPATGSQYDAKTSGGQNPNNLG